MKQFFTSIAISLMATVSAFGQESKPIEQYMQHVSFRTVTLEDGSDQLEDKKMSLAKDGEYFKIDICIRHVKGQKRAVDCTDDYAHLRLRYADDKMYVLDTKTGTETVGIDFAAKPGDEVTAYNGSAWKVTAATDTTIALPKEAAIGEDEPAIKSVTARKLTVCNSEGITDEWISGFGSQRYDLLLDPIPAATHSRVLYIEELTTLTYIAFNIDDDPFHGCVYDDRLEQHSQAVKEDKAWLEGADLNLMLFNQTAFYEGSVVYLLGVRTADNLNITYDYLQPVLEGGEQTTLAITLPGLPVPQSGTYAITLNGKPFAEVKSDATTINTVSPTLNTQTTYNLQGQKVGEDYKGIVIKNRRKEVQK